MLLLEEAIYKSNPFTDYAIEHGLDKWDHYYFFLSLFLAIMTLTISSIALVVACKTLKSQKNTEKNTTPDINRDIQLNLVHEYISSFYNSIFDLSALNYALIKTKYQTKPSHPLWSRFIEPKDYLFEKVFYYDIDKFDWFIKLKNSAIEYNEGVKRLELLIEENATKEEINQEFSFLYDCVPRIINNILEVLHISFELPLLKVFERIPLIDNLSEGVFNWILGKENIEDKTLSISEIQKSNNVTKIEKDIIESLSISFKKISYGLSDPIYFFCSLYFHHSYNDELEEKVHNALYEQIRSSVVEIIMDKLDFITYKDSTFLYYLFPKQIEKTEIKAIFGTLGRYVLFDK